jgi:cytoskeletal protein CcmA (bactofilin family)
MSDHLIADGSFINSIVGEGTRFRGELDLNGLLRIDGDYSGTIRTPGKVLVGKNGRAECTIKAETVVVGGVVKGNIFSTEKVIVLSTGMIIGNITSPRLIVEEGVVLNGNCIITKDRSSDVSASQAGDVSQKAAGSGSEEENSTKEGEESLEKAANNVPEGQEENKELSAWKR